MEFNKKAFLIRKAFLLHLSRPKINQFGDANY